MTNYKKPKKILLDLRHSPETPMICEKISRTGIPCMFITEYQLKKVIDTDERSFRENSGKTSEEKKEEEELQSILVITDDAQKASQYKDMNIAVLVYLHEENKEQSFPQNRFFIEGFADADATYFTRIYQREKQIPWLIGETERLILREMTVEDTDALYRLYEDKAVVEFMEDLPFDKEEERKYIADYIDKVYGFFGFGMWLAELRTSGEIVGRVGFQNYEENSVELGFLIAPKHQHKGYAYESCMAAIAYMKEEYPEYHRMARCRKENKRAIALCQRLNIECRIVENNIPKFLKRE